MKQIVNLSRILVGVLFIVSGLIKLNDPVGFSFKLKDSFTASDTIFYIFLGVICGLTSVYFNASLKIGCSISSRDVTSSVLL